MGRLVVCTLLALCGVASARPASSGWFAEGGAGVVAVLPSHASDAAPGPGLDVRFGRDLFPWLSIGGILAASSHEATVPPPPTGEWFQLYRIGGDARLGGRIDKIALFVEGGVGVALISSNVLSKVMVTDPGESFSIEFTGGAGLEYQLENRHYAIGLAADAFLMPQFDTLRALDTRLYLRYTAD